MQCKLLTQTTTKIDLVLNMKFLSYQKVKLIYQSKTTLAEMVRTLKLSYLDSVFILIMVGISSGIQFMTYCILEDAISSKY